MKFLEDNTENDPEASKRHTVSSFADVFELCPCFVFSWRARVPTESLIKKVS